MPYAAELTPRAIEDLEKLNPSHELVSAIDAALTDLESDPVGKSIPAGSIAPFGQIYRCKLTESSLYGSPLKRWMRVLFQYEADEHRLCILRIWIDDPLLLI